MNKHSQNFVEEVLGGSPDYGKRVASRRWPVSNVYMGLVPVCRRNVGLKAAAVTVAVGEWERAGEPGNGPVYQIFEQQATQGYYDDAAATGHLFKRVDDVQWSIVEWAKIRAENGDI
jgi:hypothetical protein